jgi:hypothetical protein
MDEAQLVELPDGSVLFNGRPFPCGRPVSGGGGGGGGCGFRTLARSTDAGERFHTQPSL